MINGQTLLRFRTLKPGMELVLIRRFRQKREKLFAALSTPERISDWMDVEWLGDAAPLQAGSRFSYRFRNSDMVSEGRVIALDCPGLIEHSWFENIPPAATIRWALEEDGEGCLLTLTQSYPGKDDAARNGAGWTMILGQLDAWLDGTPFRPAESWQKLRARYAESMGPAALRDGHRLVVDGGPAVQFKRLLPFAVEECWAWLTEPAKLADWLGDVDVELRPGGAFRIRFQMAPVVMEGTVLSFAAPHQLKMIWREPWFEQDTVFLTFDLAAQGNDTLMTLTHVFPDGYDPIDYLAGWHEFLDAVEEAMAGIPFVWDRPERKSAYALRDKVYRAIAGSTF